MQSIREIYVSQGDADAYFDYAAKAGLESDPLPNPNVPEAAISGFENSTPAIFTDKSAIKIQPPLR